MLNVLERLLGKRNPELFCSAVVVAAGNSSRMQGTDKIMAELDGRPVICHTLHALELCPLIHEIVVVTREDLIIPHREMHLRRFVLEPLQEIAPWVRHPVLGVTVSEMLEHLRKTEGQE